MVKTGNGLGDNKGFKGSNGRTWVGRQEEKFTGTPDPVKKERGKKHIYGTAKPCKDGYKLPGKVKN